MPLDPAAQNLVDMVEATFPDLTAPDVDAVKARAILKALPRVPFTEEVARVEDRTISGPAGIIPVRVYTPLEAASEPAPGIVYFHGGGWVLCDLDSHDGACRRMSNAIGAVVVSVDYRLAPEHKFPAAIDDSYAATQWVAAHAAELGVDAGRLAVAGDSAGGNLAAVVAQIARDRGGPVLAFQLLVYPVIDSTTTRNDRPSKRENAEGYVLSTAHMNWYREQYLPDDAAGELPNVSPHRAESLAGLAPACVVTAEMDPLRDEGDEYARQLEAAGVRVTAYCAPGMYHGFFNMDRLLDGAKEAQRVAFTAMRDALGVSLSPKRGD